VDGGERTWRRAAAAFVLFGGVGLIFLFGAPVLGLNGAAQARLWLSAAHGPWALPAVVLAFAGLAFLGVPQVVLIAAVVVVFGPWRGLGYSWTGTLVSALVGFGLGRAVGGRLLMDVSGPTLQRFMALVGRNGFLASLVVRLVPFAPFILVNMAAGVTPMGWLDFAFGTAIGILPKIAVLAFAGRSVVQIMHGAAAPLGWLGLATAVWLLGGYLAARWLRR